MMAATVQHPLYPTPYSAMIFSYNVIYSTMVEYKQEYCVTWYWSRTINDKNTYICFICNESTRQQQYLIVLFECCRFSHTNMSGINEGKTSILVMQINQNICAAKTQEQYKPGGKKEKMHVFLHCMWITNIYEYF